MANVSRPAQGNNSNRPRNWPRPAYVQDAAPVVVSSGSISHPNDGPVRFSGKRLVADATPKIVNL